MGNSTYNPSDWTAYRATKSTQSQQQIFRSSNLSPKLDPLNIKFRESRDSSVNPQSTPIIVCTDVTGSMGVLAETIVKHSLGPLFSEIYTRKPVTDPHIMFMANGDVYCDRAPLQVSQFEAGHKEIVEQLELTYLEGGGGGNGGESYNIPWYFAARKTVHDAFEKRGKKGFLFTVGDELPHDVLPKTAIKSFIGDTVERDLTSRELLDMVSKTYEVYHLVVNERGYRRGIPTKWKDLMGDRAIELTSIDKLAEVIVSILEVAGGKDKNAVISSWSGDTSLVVANAIKDIEVAKGKSKGVVRF